MSALKNFVAAPETEEFNSYLLSGLAQLMMSPEFTDPILEEHGVEYVNGPLADRVEAVLKGGLNETATVLALIEIIENFYGDVTADALARASILNGSITAMLGVMLWAQQVCGMFLPANRDIEAEGLDMDEALAISWASYAWSK